MMTGGTAILGHHHILNFRKNKLVWEIFWKGTSSGNVKKEEKPDVDEQRWEVQKHIGEFSVKMGL